MKKFIALLSNKNKSNFSVELLNAHVEYLKKLHQEGRLFLCGPFEDNDGALQILLASNLQEAEKLLWSDPFIQSKYYASFVLHELIEANETNDWLLTK